MQLDSFLCDALSRRRFFRTAGVSVAGGSAVLVAACAEEETSSRRDPERDAESVAADVEILNAALDLELMAVAAYRAGARLLEGDARDVGRTFLEHEREHAEALSRAILDLGGRPHRARPRYDIPELRSQEDVLRFAVDVENVAIAAYIDALPKLSRGELRGTAAAIVTNEAEHVAVLLGALGRPPAPDAFVTGKAA